MDKQSKNYKEVLVIFIIAVSLFSFIRISSLNNRIDSLEREVKRLTYDLDDVSQQFDELEKSNSLISDSRYSVQEVKIGDKVEAKVKVNIVSNKLGSYPNLNLEYRVSYDSNKPDNHNYSNEEWKSVPLKSINGTYQAEFTVPFSCNYKLHVAFGEDKKINYEQLPLLNIYAKGKLTFIKDINIYSIKNGILKYDAQIAKFNEKEDRVLLKAMCKVYYGDEVIKEIDILEENKVEGRKQPRAMLEHKDGNYWFIIDEVDFSNIEEFNKDNVKIELILKDSIGNNYRLEKGLN